MINFLLAIYQKILSKKLNCNMFLIFFCIILVVTYSHNCYIRNVTELVLISPSIKRTKRCCFESLAFQGLALKCFTNSRLITTADFCLAPSSTIHIFSLSENTILLQLIVQYQSKFLKYFSIYC